MNYLTIFVIYLFIFQNLAAQDCVPGVNTNPWGINKGETKNIGKVTYRNYGTCLIPIVIPVDARGTFETLNQFLLLEVSLPEREQKLKKPSENKSMEEIMAGLKWDADTRLKQNEVIRDPLNLRAITREDNKPLRYIADFVGAQEIVKDYEQSVEEPYKRIELIGRSSFDIEHNKSVSEFADEFAVHCKGEIPCIEKLHDNLSGASFDSDLERKTFFDAQKLALERAKSKKDDQSKTDNDAKVAAAILAARYSYSKSVKDIKKAIDLNGVKIDSLKELINNMGTQLGNIEIITQETQRLIEQNIEYTNIGIELARSNNNILKSIDDKVDFSNEVSMEILKNQWISSPLSKKLEDLKNPKSKIYQMFDGSDSLRLKRNELIEQLGSAIKYEKTVETIKKVQEYGKVFQEAVNVFCHDCSDDIKDGINLGLKGVDIFGSLLTQNYSAALMQVFGLFKKPQPSPEFQMLQQIQSQLVSMEKNMGKQFDGMHQHLNIMERNITDILFEMDRDIFNLHKDLTLIRGELLSELANIDKKLDVILRQNQCTQDILVKLGKRNVNTCSYLAQKWNYELQQEKIKNLDDVRSFFNAYNCTDCINEMLNLSGKALSSEVLFKYTMCDKVEGNIDLESMYDILYSEILDKNGKYPKDIKMESLLYIPKSVENHPKLTEKLRTALLNSDGKALELVTADATYRNYREVLDYSNNFLTLLPLLELYNSQISTTMTLEEMVVNQSFSQKRLSGLKDGLNDIIELLDHTKMQQSLMAGVGVFEEIQNTIINFVRMDLQKQQNFKKMMNENMNLNKNYTAYLGYTHISKNRIKSLNNSMKQNEKRIFTISDQKFEVEKKGMHLLLNYYGDKANTESIFTGALAYGGNEYFDEMYESNINFSVPSSITELEEMKERLYKKLYELEIVTNPELDNPNSKFTRDDLYNIIALNSRN